MGILKCGRDGHNSLVVEKSTMCGSIEYYEHIKQWYATINMICGHFGPVLSGLMVTSSKLGIRENIYTQLVMEHA